MPKLTVRITKRTDGGAVLKCVRADGSETWQKQQGSYAAFFPMHDLTHFAVETELGARRAFYGLIAEGWSIEETGERPREPLPIEAIFVEHVVGTLDSERAGGARWTADEFNDTLAISFRKNGKTVPRTLTDDELARVRKRRAELFARWQALAAGDTLELAFN